LRHAHPKGHPRRRLAAKCSRSAIRSRSPGPSTRAKAMASPVPWRATALPPPVAPARSGPLRRCASQREFLAQPLIQREALPVQRRRVAAFAPLLQAWQANAADPHVRRRINRVPSLPGVPVGVLVATPVDSVRFRCPGFLKPAIVTESITIGSTPSSGSRSPTPTTRQRLARPSRMGLGLPSLPPRNGNRCRPIRTPDRTLNGPPPSFVR
jgi:hypothetical protein